MSVHIVEWLEQRICFAAVLDPAGNLIVEGTPGDDTIEVRLVRHEDFEDRIWIEVNGQQIPRPYGEAVNRVVIRSLGGDDTIRCSVFEPVAVEAGEGNDRVTLTLSSADIVDAGAGNDSVYAGGGNDKVLGGDGDDTLSGGAQKDHLDGGVGNDRLNGNGGHDRLFGGPNADRLFGYDGDDWLEGGSSIDRLEGGNGVDWMYGVGGDDRFFAVDSTIDHLFGGKDNDTATVDASDVLANIEITS